MPRLLLPTYPQSLALDTTASTSAIILTSAGEMPALTGRGQREG
jgi:hypothetical protein